MVAALAAGYWLVAWGRSLSAEGFAGVCVFVATMVWLYLASTVYHALPQGRVLAAQKRLHAVVLGRSRSARRVCGTLGRAFMPASTR